MALPSPSQLSDWVTQHPVLPDSARARVINLSYGTDSARGIRLIPSRRLPRMRGSTASSW